MKLKRRHAKRGRVEIIPMIDAILILLIFYMSFSSLQKSERRIDAKLPVIARSIVVSPDKVPLDFTVKVFSKDRIIVNGGGTPFDTETLRDAMLQLAAIDQEVTVIIEAEPTTEYSDVIGALDACALANLKKVAFRPLPEPTATP